MKHRTLDPDPSWIVRRLYFLVDQVLTAIQVLRGLYQDRDDFMASHENHPHPLVLEALHLSEWYCHRSTSGSV